MLLLNGIVSFLYPIIAKVIMDEGILKNNFNVVLMAQLGIIILIFTEVSVGIYRQNSILKIKANIVKELYKKALLKLKKIKLSYFETHNRGEFINQLDLDLNTISELIDESLCEMGVQAFSILGGLIALIILDYRLTIIVVLYIPIKATIISLLSKKNEAIAEEYINSKSEFIHLFEDSLLGMQEIRIYGVNEEDKWQNRVESVLMKEKKMSILISLNNSIETILAQVFSSSIYIVGAKFIFNLEMTIGELLAFMTYSAFVTNPLNVILNIKYMLSSIMPSLNRYYKFLDMEEECDYGENLIDQKEFDLIAFNNVSFGYDPGGLILKNINFVIYQNQKIAVVGDNGSGKTTLIKLILRFMEPTNGQITLNGLDIKEYGLKEYRNLFGVCFQNNYIFDDTLKENIVLGSEISQTDYIEILKKINWNVEDEAQEGAKLVGCNGAKLSGGQHQKIALGRVFVKNRKLLILDEAGANLDKKTKNELYRIMFNQLKDMTIIVITHNTEVLSQFDKVLFLKNGIIDGFKKHDILYKNSTSYFEFINNKDKGKI